MKSRRYGNRRNSSFAVETGCLVRYPTNGMRADLLFLGARVLRGVLLCLAVLGAVSPARAHTHLTRHPARQQRRRVHRRHLPRRASPAPLSAASTVLAYPAPPIQARAAILVDTRSGAVLYQKNADARLAMASTTKITTAILAIQHGGLSHLVRVSHQAATVGESTMGLVEGERLTARQLLYGLLLNSGNDAAIALAQHVAGSVPRFVARMNDLAHRLHMRNTHYVTPHGLDEPGHYSSARDLSIIARYAMRNATFRRIVVTENYHILATSHNREHWLANINRVLYWYPGINGVKPGQTDNAGLCQVVSVNRDGKQLVAVLLNTPNLVTDIRNLLNYGLHDFRWERDPLFWDGPGTPLTGRAGTSNWVYYLGAGHYVSGVFLHYFSTHGGLKSLGYPRTDVIEQGGRQVQYFQAAELVYDPTHDSAYPEALGLDEARRAVPRPQVQHAAVNPALAGLYRSLGGRGVLGAPVTKMVWANGARVQFFAYGELGLAGGTAVVVPVGDEALRQLGWLPAAGAANSYPTTVAPSLIASVR